MYVYTAVKNDKISVRKASKLEKGFDNKNERPEWRAIVVAL